MHEGLRIALRVGAGGAAAETGYARRVPIRLGCAPQPPLDGKPYRPDPARLLTDDGHAGLARAQPESDQIQAAVLVERLGFDDEPHDTGLLRGVPNGLSPLEPVSRICYMVQRFLRAHPGFDRADLQGYLDLL